MCYVVMGEICTRTYTRNIYKYTHSRARSRVHARVRTRLDPAESLPNYPKTRHKTP